MQAQWAVTNSSEQFLYFSLTLIFVMVAGVGLEDIAGKAVPFFEAIQRLGLHRASVTGLIAAGILETVEHERRRGIPASSIDGFVRLMEGKDYVFTLQHRIHEEKGISLSAMSNVVYKYGQLLKDAGLIEYLGESARHYTIVYPLGREAELQAVLAHGISALGCTEEKAASICARFGLNEFHRKVLVSSGISLKDFDTASDGRKVLDQGYLQECYGISIDSFYHRFPRRVGSLLANGTLVMVGEEGLNRHFFMYDAGREGEFVAALRERRSSHSNGAKEPYGGAMQLLGISPFKEALGAALPLHADAAPNGHRAGSEPYILDKLLQQMTGYNGSPTAESAQLPLNGVKQFWPNKEYPSDYFSVGDRIGHHSVPIEVEPGKVRRVVKNFGLGTVLAVMSDTIKVRFDNGEERQLLVRTR